ncbi:DUF4215 domain-containing protein [Candidatus Dojkabacteria bacterium]|nr:DUF4215 domain-containing protein [Candidatus Dojkabacteria bacterium]
MSFGKIINASEPRINEFLRKMMHTYLLFFLVGVSFLGLGYMLFREVRYIIASAPCPDPLKSPIETLVILDANDYSADNIIDCSAVDIEIRNGGTLQILPFVIDNTGHEDDLGLIIQARNLTVQQGGKIDLAGLGYGPGIQAGHIGSGKSSNTPETCQGFDCGGSGAGHYGAGGRGDPDFVNNKVAGIAGQRYGTDENATTLGSGGGESSKQAPGGAGGGAVKFDISNALILDGEINASGKAGQVTSDTGGGGGAGGSIWIEAETFSGSGSSVAEGGDGGFALKNGGGGGGGRITMRCRSGNSYSGTASVNYGEGGVQDGGPGLLIGPSCYPPNPLNLKQNEIIDDDPFTIQELPDGASTKDLTLYFTMTVSDIDNPSILYPEIEIVEKGHNFQGSSTKIGSAVVYEGTPIEANVTVANLVKTKEYKWRARVKDSKGVVSNWTDYGGDGDLNDIDFIVLGNPAMLVKISGDNQTGTVGLPLSQPFVVELQDSVGHAIHEELIDWQVKQGGGSLSVEEIETNNLGRAETTLTLGTVAGTNNNIVDAIYGVITGSPMKFTATANPDVLDHYTIDAPFIALVNVNFDPEVVISARDQYENLITTNTDTVNLSAVLAEDGCPDACNPGNGVITPSDTTLVNGESSINNFQYSAVEYIRIKGESGGILGYSNTVSVVNEFGSCFGIANDPANSPLVINENKYVTANPYYEPEADFYIPSGIIDCSNIDLTIESGVEIKLRGDDGGAYDGDLQRYVGTNDSSDDIPIYLIAKSLNVKAAAHISGDRMGYTARYGPGSIGEVSGANTWSNSFANPGGGSYGGFGGGVYSGSRIYGDVHEPTSLGSGGGVNISHGSPGFPGGEGGSAIHINVLNNFTLSGSLTSIGGDGYEGAAGGNGGGSGGSIFIETDSITVNPGALISASGGHGQSQLVATGKGGSGGRISLNYNTSSYDFSSYNSVNALIKAYGGNIWNTENTTLILTPNFRQGGPGTIFIKQGSSNGSLFINNNNIAARSAAIYDSDTETYLFDKIDMKGYGSLEIFGQGSRLILPGGAGISVPGAVLFGDNSHYPKLTIHGTLDYTGGGVFYINELDIENKGKLQGINDITIGNNTTGGLMLHANTWYYSGSYSFEDILVNSGQLKLVSFDNKDFYYNNDYGLELNVQSLNIASNGIVSGSGLGYGNDMTLYSDEALVYEDPPGPGGGYLTEDQSSFGGGGTYGGYGERNDVGDVYGDVYRPVSLGSRGSDCAYITAAGYGGAGGGAFHVKVENSLIVNGVIESNSTGAFGYPAYYCNRGSGSAGSIWLETNILEGSGLITANNNNSGDRGDGEGNDGSGGRIAVYYDTNNSYPIDVDHIQARSHDGGPGTIYIEQVDFSQGAIPQYQGDLYVDNNRNDNRGRQAGIVEDIYTFNKIELTRFGDLDVVGNGSILNVASGSSLIGDETISRLTVEGTFNYTGANTLFVNTINLRIKGEILGVDDVTIGNLSDGIFTLFAKTWAHNGNYSFGDMNVESQGSFDLISYASDDYIWTDDFGVNVSLDNLNIANGGIVSASGYGYGQDNVLISDPTYGFGDPPGHGGNPTSQTSRYGGGATHSGYGEDNTVGQVYGSVYKPLNLGTKGSDCYNIANGQGYGGAGGGAIFFDIAYGLINNGVIKSNGANSSGVNCNRGGGSGGSIYIITKDLSGSGYIKANGAGGNDLEDDYGSGGRISLYYENNNGFPINVENIQARGVNAGPGTIYAEQLYPGYDPLYRGTLYVDNNDINSRQAGLINVDLDENIDYYQFDTINLTRYGDLDVLGEGTGCTNINYTNKTDCENNGFLWDGGSELVILGENGIVGDSTSPELRIFGTFVSPAILSINGAAVGINGDIRMGSGPSQSQLTIGDQGASLSGGLVLYANTWAHDYDNPFILGSVDIGSNGYLKTIGHDNLDMNWENDFGVNLILENLTINEGSCSNPTYNNKKDCEIGACSNTNYRTKIECEDKGYIWTEGSIWGGQIKADGYGYGQAAVFGQDPRDVYEDPPGPGANGQYNHGGGGSHGGFGEDNLVGEPNGSVFEPKNLGTRGSDCIRFSAKGYGGAGGGSLKLRINNEFINNGILSFKGTESWGDSGCNRGGGAGGSIYIETNTINGSGIIDASAGGGYQKGTVTDTNDDYGSGGRIALYYMNNNGYTIDSGHIYARGGNGGPGTVYIEQVSNLDTKQFDGKIYVDNNNVVGREAALAAITQEDPVSNYQFEKIYLTRHGHLEILGEGTGCSDGQYKTKTDCENGGSTWNSGTTLIITDNQVLSGDTTSPILTARGTFVVPSILELKGITLGLKGDIRFGTDNSSSELYLGDNNASNAAGLVFYGSSWAHDPDTMFVLGDVNLDKYSVIKTIPYIQDNTNWEDDYGIGIHAVNLDINESACTNGSYTTRKTCEDNGYVWGGLIHGDGLGYGQIAVLSVYPEDVFQTITGPGGGGLVYNYNGGASHGGYGEENDDGVLYGDIYEPKYVGSRGSDCTFFSAKGYGGSGGGALHLIVDNDLVLNGEIDMNGIDAWGWGCGSGTGSGGSVYVETNNLSGNGYIKTNGGGYNSTYKHGAGGRIALYYNSNTGFPIDGTHLQSWGYNAGPGTVYAENRQEHNPNEGDFIISNGGTTNIEYGPDLEAQDYIFNNVSIESNVLLRSFGYIDILPEGISYPIPPEDNKMFGNDNTVGIWHMDEESNGSCLPEGDFCDLTSNSNHGSIVGATIVDGKNRKGRDFNGTNNYGLVPGIDLPTSNFTYIVWVKLDSVSDEVILQSTDGNAGNEFYMWIDDRLEIAVNGSRYVGTTVLQTGTWYQLAATRDGSTVKVYLNDTSQGTWTNNFELDFAGCPLVIGADVDSGCYGSLSNWADGIIDEIFILNRGLSQQEIQEYYSMLLNTNSPDVVYYNQYIDDYRTAASERVGRGSVFYVKNFTLGSGAIIDGNGQGFATDKGKGAGGTGDESGGASSGGAGGTHGGFGGSGSDNGGIPGGSATYKYGSEIEPFTLGSGGGTSGDGDPGGSGGGAFAIISEDDESEIIIDGTIRMDGLPGVASSPGGGGGAGGSIYISGDNITLGATGSLLTRGGTGGVDPIYGGGGGGGFIVLTYTGDFTDDGGTISKAGGDGGAVGFGAGEGGVFGSHGIPSIYLQNQYDSSDQELTIGETITDKEIKFKLNVTDPDATDNLTPDVEILFANEGDNFDDSNVLTGSSLVWNRTDPIVPIELQITIERQDSQVIISDSPSINVLGVSTNDLLLEGEAYKWRARVIDGDGFASDWEEFGANGDGTDFQVAAAPSCGNGVIEGIEECDGGDLGGATCITEGYTGGNLICRPSCTFDTDGCWQCGNTIIEPGNGEQCDDGDLGGLDCTDFNDFDGGTLVCSGTCLYDTSGCTKNPQCGNGLTEPGEQCDDGNTNNGDGCSSSCIIEGYGGYCGDGILQTGEGEECDDGNTVSGDGCSNVCTTEAFGYCGDGARQSSEQCDDGNQVSGDGCSNACRIEIAGYCGDGTLQTGEQCDDGNQESGDGCSNICTNEAGYCGNGIRERGEQCDGDVGESNCTDFDEFTDGTLTCSATCTFDTTKCTKKPSCGNGIVEPGEQCDGDVIDKKCEDFFGYFGGRIKCNDRCVYDMTGCLREGEAIITGLPFTGNLRTIILAILDALAILLAIISLLLGFPSLLFKKEKKPWGLVYDEDSQAPIAFAVVRLYQGGKVVVEKVTDLEGRYGFAVSQASYELEVRHDAYEDFKTRVDIKDELAGAVNRDIALLSLQSTGFNFKRWFKKNLANAREIFPKLSIYSYWLGFAFSTIAVFISPIIYNVAVILFYFLLGIVYLLVRMKRGWGIVTDSSTNKGLENVFVRLFDAKENKLIDNQICDKGGKYIFISEPGLYNLQASFKGYSFPSKKEKGQLVKTFFGNLVQVEHKKRTLGVDLLLDPLTKSELDALRLQGQAVPGDEKFGSPFGGGRG